MSVEIIWFSGSPFAWRVLLGATVKGIDYESRLIQASESEHKSRSFLALNPRGKVPVLRHGNVVVAESLAILAYLDRAFPDRPIFGHTAEETGKIWHAIFDFENNAPVLKFVTPIFFGGLADKMDAVKEAAHAVDGELAALDIKLRDREWLVGSEISAADIAIFPIIQLFARGHQKAGALPFEVASLPIIEKRPALGAWCERIEALPGYDATYPPHWR